MKYLITGITGFAAPHLAQLLLKEGHEVHGLTRATSGRETDLLDMLSTDELNAITFQYADLSNYERLYYIIANERYDGVFHLAAQSVAEDEYLPIRTSKKLDYYTFKELWNKIAMHNTIDVKNVDGVKTEIIKLKGDQTKAVGFYAGMGQWMSITHITRHKYKGVMKKIKSKYGTVTVTPNHSIYNSNMELVEGGKIDSVFPIRKINYLSGKSHFKVKLKTFEYEKNHTFFWRKNNSAKFPLYLDNDNIEQFAKFCGAYITEGSASSSKGRNGIVNDYNVSISNNNRCWLEDIDRAIKSIVPGLTSHYTRTTRKDGDYFETYNLRYKSKVLHDLMIYYCGKTSCNKKIPDFMFQVNDSVKWVLYHTLMYGDGEYINGKYTTRERYTTTSKLLACQLTMLMTQLNVDYCTDVVYDSDEKNNNGLWQVAYRVNTVNHYQLSQGNDVKIEDVEYDGYVYDLTIHKSKNFTVGFGNLLVHNSHPAISFDDPIMTFQDNVMGTVNLITVIERVSCKTVIHFCSTSEYYGDECKTSGILKESDPAKAVNPYGVSKAAMDLYMQERLKNGFINGFITRAFSHTGIRRFKNFSISSDAYQLAQMKVNPDALKVLRVGNLETQRVVIDVKDTVRAYYMLMQKCTDHDFNSSNKGIFNVCGTDVHKMGYFTDLLIRVSDLIGVKKVIEPKFYRDIDIQVQIGDSTRLKELTGWKPEIPIEQTMEDLFNYWVKKLS